MFLRDPDEVIATNNESEFELRFNVIARKPSDGNRNSARVAVQERLPSIIRTCCKLSLDPIDDLRTVITTTTNPVPLLLTTGRQSGTVRKTR